MKSPNQKLLVEAIPSTVQRGQFKSELFRAMDKLNIASRCLDLDEIDLTSFDTIEEKYTIKLEISDILKDAYHQEFGWVINDWQAANYVDYEETQEKQHQKQLLQEITKENL
ncbi:MAG: hypothetical protein ACRDD4_06940 [Culicoidibacterales bacterium]